MDQIAIFKKIRHSKNSFLVFTDQLLNSVITFLITVMISRFMIPSQFGIFSFIVIGMYLLITLSNSFILTPFQINKFSGRELNFYHSNLFYIQTFCILIFVILTASTFIFFSHPLITFSSMCIYITGQLYFDFFRKYNLSVDNITGAIKLSLINVLCQLISLGYIYLFNQWGLNLLLYLFGTSALVSSFFCFINLTFKKIYFRYFRKHLSYHFSCGKWHLLTSFVQWGSTNLMIFITSLFLSLEAIGAFRLVQSLFGLLNIIYQTFENYILPRTNEIFRKSKKEAISFLKWTFIKYSIPIILLLLFMCIFSEDLMEIVFGKQFINYHTLIYYMSVLYIVIFLIYPIRIYIRINLLHSKFFIGHLFSFLFSTISSYFLIQKLNLFGVVLILLLNQLIMAIYWLNLLYKNK